MTQTVKTERRWGVVDSDGGEPGILMLGTLSYDPDQSRRLAVQFRSSVYPEISQKRTDAAWAILAEKGYRLARVKIEVTGLH